MSPLRHFPLVRGAASAACILALGACAQAPDPAPDPAPADLSETPPGQRAPERSSGAATAPPTAALPTAALPPVDPAALRPDGLDPAVRACLPVSTSEPDADFYETGRATDTNGDVYVALEWWERLTPDAAFDVQTALVRFRDGACEVLVEPEYGSEEIDQSALMPPSVYDEIQAETLAWKVAVAGGREAYVDRAREIHTQMDYQHRECSPSEDSPSCVTPSYAALLRGLGLEVLPPGRAPSDP